MRRFSSGHFYLQVTLLTIALATVLTRAAQSQTFTVIHTFGSGSMSGPEGVTIDKAGNLYGTAMFSNGIGNGGVFKLAHKGSSWLFNPLYTFGGSNDGIQVNPGIVLGPDGGLYGTTALGGGTNCVLGNWNGCGTVYELQPPPRACQTALCPWSETILYRFQGGGDDYMPTSGPVVFDTQGNLYGATQYGGIGNCEGFFVGCGTVYELSRSGGGWTEQVLYRFDPASGVSEPTGGLVMDAGGSLYGETDPGNGTVFQLTNGESGWTQTILYSFQPGNNGMYPIGGLVFDMLSNLYGVTGEGGSGGDGTAFQLSPAHGSWNFSLLWTFTGGTGPSSPLIIDSVGNLYGMTWGDGDYGLGSVFKLSPSNGGWTETILHSFTGGSDGEHPQANLVFDKNGNLYGAATGGGATGNGVIFEIIP